MKAYVDAVSKNRNSIVYTIYESGKLVRKIHANIAWRPLQHAHTILFINTKSGIIACIEEKTNVNVNFNSMMCTRTEEKKRTVQIRVYSLHNPQQGIIATVTEPQKISKLNLSEDSKFRIMLTKAVAILETILV